MGCANSKVKDDIGVAGNNRATVIPVTDASPSTTAMTANKNNTNNSNTNTATSSTANNNTNANTTTNHNNRSGNTSDSELGRPKDCEFGLGYSVPPPATATGTGKQSVTRASRTKRGGAKNNSSEGGDSAHNRDTVQTEASMFSAKGDPDGSGTAQQHSTTTRKQRKGGLKKDSSYAGGGSSTNNNNGDGGGAALTAEGSSALTAGGSGGGGKRPSKVKRSVRIKESDSFLKGKKNGAGTGTGEFSTANNSAAGVDEDEGGAADDDDDGSNLRGSADVDFRSFKSFGTIAMKNSASNKDDIDDDDFADLGDVVVDDDDDMDMESAQEGEDVADPNDLCGLGGACDGDLGQTVTIYHAGIEIDVITAMMRDGGEIVQHKKSGPGGGPRGAQSGTFHQRGRSAGSAIGAGDDAFDDDEEYEEEEYYEEDESYTETVSMASETSDVERDDVVATASTVFGPRGGVGSASANNNNANGDNAATFRLVKRGATRGATGGSFMQGSPSAAAARAAALAHEQKQKAAGDPSSADAAPAAGAAAAAKPARSNLAGADGSAPSPLMENHCDATSAAGQLINKRLTQQGKFDLSVFRPGVDMLAKNLKLTPPLLAYDPKTDPRGSHDYEATAKKIHAEDPSLLSASVAIGGSGALGGSMSPRSGANFNASMMAGPRDYGRGRSAALPAMDVSSSWDLLKSIPNAVDILNKGGILFRYQAKKWSELTLSEKIEMGSFINLSKFPDEEEENDQPVIDFVNNTFTEKENDLTDMTVICARLMTLVPRVNSRDLNVDVLTSNDYQKILLASDETLEKADQPRTIRKNKTVVRFVFSFRVQMSGSERADEEELARHVHHHDVKPNRLVIMERTRKNKGPRDGTLKSKACTLFYDIPPAGYVKGGPAPAGGAAAAGGVLQSLTNITIKSSIPSAMMMLMDKIGAAIGSDCVRNTPTERVFLCKKKDEAWALMSAGGDFPSLDLPWPVQ